MHKKTRSLGLALLAATAIAVPMLSGGALAQTSSYDTACSKQPSEGDVRAAQASFVLGSKAYEEADYAKAIEYMKDAYRLDCTKAILLTYIAKAYIAKGDKAEAVSALEAYLKRSPKGSDVEAVQRQITNLKQQIATQPTANPTTSATTPATTASATTAVPTATTTAPTTTATTEPPPPPTAEGRGHTAPPWIVTIAGGAAVAGGVVMLAIGASKVSNSYNACPGVDAKGNHVCLPGIDANAASNENSTGKALETAGVIVGIVGVAAVAGGLLWHFVEPTGPEKSARVRPEIGPGYVGVGGTF